MAQATVPTAYTPVMKTVHWTTVVIVITLLGIGWTMTDNATMSRATIEMLIGWHKSLGILVLLLTLFRIAWGRTHRAPPLPPGLKPWEVVVVGVVHRLLYVLLILQPLTGWGIATLSSAKFRFFGLFEMPDLPFLAGVQQPLVVREGLEGIHGTVAGILAVLIVLHAAAAFKHHFMIRDAVLLRMAPAGLGPFLNRLRGER